MSNLNIYFNHSNEVLQVCLLQHLIDYNEKLDPLHQSMPIDKIMVRFWYGMHSRGNFERCLKPFFPAQSQYFDMAAQMVHFQPGVQ